MTGMIRVVVVDPVETSRQDLERLLGGIGNLWIAEVCRSYETASKAIGDDLPDLTIINVDADPEAAVALIQRLHGSYPDAALLPASARRDGNLILRLVRAGAREFLGLPAALEELLEAIDRLVKRDRDAGVARRNQRVIAVAGASGGVGCTTLAVNLGTALAKIPDNSVALTDFDLLLGSVNTCLDIVPDHTLLEVAADVDRIDLTLLKRSLCRHASGLHILSRPMSIEDASKIDPEGLRRVIGLLKAAFQTVLIDTSKGLQAWDFVAMDSADVILLVVQLDPVCLHNTARLLSLFRHQFEGVCDKIKIVANRFGGNAGDISATKAEEALGLPISWMIPSDFRVFLKARAQGVPVDQVAYGNKAHRAILEIADSFAPPSAAPPPKRRGKIAALFF